MAKKAKKSPVKKNHSGRAGNATFNKKKVGSDRAAAEHFAGKHDFGIPAEGAGRFPEIAEEAKFQPGGDHLSDPRQPRSGVEDTRESGVGGVDAGLGSSSGGDLDPDVVGVGTHGSGVSSAGPDSRKRGRDMIGADSARADTQQRAVRQPNAQVDSPAQSSMESESDSSIEGSGDDAAAGEISQGEAAGDDNTDTDNLS